MSAADLGTVEQFISNPVQCRPQRAWKCEGKWSEKGSIDGPMYEVRIRAEDCLMIRPPTGDSVTVRYSDIYGNWRSDDTAASWKLTVSDMERELTLTIRDALTTTEKRLRRPGRALLTGTSTSTWEQSLLGTWCNEGYWSDMYGGDGYGFSLVAVEKDGKTRVMMRVQGSSELHEVKYRPSGKERMPAMDYYDWWAVDLPGDEGHLQFGRVNEHQKVPVSLCRSDMAFEINFFCVRDDSWEAMLTAEQRKWMARVGDVLGKASYKDAPAAILPSIMLGKECDIPYLPAAAKAIVNCVAHRAGEDVDQKGRLRLNIDAKDPGSAEQVYPLLPLHLDRFCAFVKAREEEGMGTFVCCSLGRNRSSALVAAYLMREKRWPLLETVRHLMLRRGQVLGNWSFRLQLVLLAQKEGLLGMESPGELLYNTNVMAFDETGSHAGTISGFSAAGYPVIRKPDGSTMECTGHVEPDGKQRPIVFGPPSQKIVTKDTTADQAEEQEMQEMQEMQEVQEDTWSCTANANVVPTFPDPMPYDLEVLIEDHENAFLEQFSGHYHLHEQDCKYYGGPVWKKDDCDYFLSRTGGAVSSEAVDQEFDHAFSHRWRLHCDDEQFQNGKAYVVSDIGYPIGDISETRIYPQEVSVWCHWDRERGQWVPDSSIIVQVGLPTVTVTGDESDCVTMQVAGEYVPLLTTDRHWTPPTWHNAEKSVTLSAVEGHERRWRFTIESLDTTVESMPVQRQTLPFDDVVVWFVGEDQASITVTASGGGQGARAMLEKQVSSMALIPFNDQTANNAFVDSAAGAAGAASSAAGAGGAASAPAPLNPLTRPLMNDYDNADSESDSPAGPMPPPPSVQQIVDMDKLLADHLREQDAKGYGGTNYEEAAEDVKYGRKRGCWIWYVWPHLLMMREGGQLARLHMPTVSCFRQYLRHRTLRDRLCSITNTLLGWNPRKTLHDVIGWGDDEKVRECMVCMAIAAAGESDEDALKIFCSVIDASGGFEQRSRIEVAQQTLGDAELTHYAMYATKRGATGAGLIKLYQAIKGGKDPAVAAKEAEPPEHAEAFKVGAWVQERLHSDGYYLHCKKGKVVSVSGARVSVNFKQGGQQQLARDDLLLLDDDLGGWTDYYLSEKLRKQESPRGRSTVKPSSSKGASTKTATGPAEPISEPGTGLVIETATIRTGVEITSQILLHLSAGDIVEVKELREITSQGILKKRAHVRVIRIKGGNPGAVGWSSVVSAASGLAVITAYSEQVARRYHYPVMRPEMRPISRAGVATVLKDMRLACTEGVEPSSYHLGHLESGVVEVIELGTTGKGLKRARVYNATGGDSTLTGWVSIVNSQGDVALVDLPYKEEEKYSAADSAEGLAVVDKFCGMARKYGYPDATLQKLTLAVFNTLPPLFGITNAADRLTMRDWFLQQRRQDAGYTI